MRLNRLVAGIVAGCAVVAVTAAPGLAGQMAQKPGHMAAAQAKADAGMAAKCKAMMADQEKMMADMKVADQRLSDLVATMNAASGMAKTDATAAVVNEMVTQRLAMRDSMMKGQQGMMTHMMDHMQEGKDSMAKCPMMKPMAGMKN